MMKLSTCLLILTLGSTQAWTIPAPIKQAVAAASVAGALTMGPMNAHADASVFNHQYNDPNHPNCKRIVTVKEDGKAFLAGTDGNPGCPADGSGNLWRLQGEQ